jgi:hypothetical protein
VGHLALLILIPLLLYCATSTAMDLRSRRLGMGAWGAVTTGLVIVMVVGLFSQSLH